MRPKSLSPSVEAPQNKAQASFDLELATGELLESADFLERAGWTHRSLGKALLAARVFRVEVAGVQAYPAFYLDPRYKRKDVEAATKLLGDLSGGSKWLFFTTPKGSLARPTSSQHAPTKSKAAAGGVGRSLPAPVIARTPLQALEDGDVQLVKRAAAGYAQR